MERERMEGDNVNHRFGESPSLKDATAVATERPCDAGRAVPATAPENWEGKATRQKS